MFKKSIALSLASIIGVSACASSTDGNTSRLEKADKILAGFERTSETENCLSLRRISNIKSLGERGFLVKVGRRDYYLNEATKGCRNADSPGNRIQYETSVNRLCRGEIIQVVDNGQGFAAGSCSLGTFIKLEKKEADAE